MAGEEGVTGRGVPLGHAIVNTVDDRTCGTFLLAMRLVMSSCARPAVVMTDMDHSLSNAFHWAYTEAQLPKSYWCLFHVYKAWFQKLTGVNMDLYKGLKGLAAQLTKADFDRVLGELRTSYGDVHIKLKKGEFKPFWDYFDLHYLRYEVR